MTDLQHADPPFGGTLTYIESVIPALVPSEQRVARQIVEHPEDVPMMSAADLAARTGTSAATVIRACQSLGFKGFQHLRLLLLRDQPSRLEPAAVSHEGPPREWIPSMFRSAGDELANSLAPLDFDQFDRAVTAMTGARRLLLIGNGASAPIAQLANLGFLNSSRPSEAPADAVVQQLTARSLGSRDVCVCISGSGSNSVTLRSAEAAGEAGATVIGVTSYQRSRLHELSNITLVCGASISKWSTGLITGNVAHVLLFAALELAISVEGGLPATDAAVMEGVMTLVGRDADDTDDADSDELGN
ncbi:MurR/RpiR family transcriptional regulator [Subtercola endophyticus]|uniref:MurR/RpiR family transcriptional regulator n=1 Tax=Subtercola endophyticus TaxID=2895559 RepID=UPI001E353735|nr:MurR/RpiR family transcriptional regulator [Subtercola endophyticus]UFS60647.1 MurR/RpiR family transcriptional regulator [Subtercola endophyticus]